jgi:hypothetical protein
MRRCFDAINVGSVLVLVLITALVTVQVRAPALDDTPHLTTLPLSVQWFDLWAAHYAEAASRRAEYTLLSDSHLCTDTAAMSIVEGAAEVCRDARTALRESDAISSAWDATRALWVRKLRAGTLVAVGAGCVAVIGLYACCKYRKPSGTKEWNKHFYSFNTGDLNKSN